MKNTLLLKIITIVAFIAVFSMNSRAQFVVVNNLSAGNDITFEIEWTTACPGSGSTIVRGSYTSVAGASSTGYPTPVGYEQVLRFRILNSTCGSIRIGCYGTGGGVNGWVNVVDCTYPCPSSSGSTIPLYNFCPSTPVAVGGFNWTYCSSLPITGSLVFHP